MKRVIPAGHVGIAVLLARPTASSAPASAAPVIPDLRSSASRLEGKLFAGELSSSSCEVSNGETPPERAIIRLNRIREEANLEHLRVFAEARGQKIYLFPARHDAPTGTNLDRLTLLRMIYQVGEQGYLKGPGFFAFTKGMPIMLQQNTNTYAGLVNGMRGTAEEVILDASVQGIQPQIILVGFTC